MSRADTALPFGATRTPDPAGKGQVLAFVLILLVLVPPLAVVALCIFLVRSVEYVPRAVQWCRRNVRFERKES